MALLGTSRFMRRVVVTGLGLVTPLGCGVAPSWSNLLAGRSGVGQLGDDFADLPATIGARVPRRHSAGKKDSDPAAAEAAAVAAATATANFSPAAAALGADALFDPQRYAASAQNVPFIAFAMEAARQALEDAAWRPESEEARCATGVAIGSGIGSIQDTVDSAIKMTQPRGHRKLSPYFVPRILVNMAGGNVSIEHGLRGPNHCCATACATGAHAIGDAFRMVERGDADVMVCGGTESCIDQLSVAGFARAQVCRGAGGILPFLQRRR
jgi:3-oxoacyl-[acyl-carrier-protein] synthase II